MPSSVIIGIGNPYRGDDSAGWAVVDALGTLEGIDLVKVRSDFAELLELFSSYTNVYVVDACQNSEQVGSWLCLDLLEEEIEEKGLSSTHGFGLVQAVAFAKSLDQLPQKLQLYAIVGRQYEVGSNMSSEVVQAIDHVKQALLAEVRHA